MGLTRHICVDFNVPNAPMKQHYYARPLPISRTHVPSTIETDARTY